MVLVLVARALCAPGVAAGDDRVPDGAVPDGGVPDGGVPDCAVPDASERLSPDADRGSELADLDVGTSDLPAYGARAVAHERTNDTTGRASETVTREQMDERLARSAPDALRWVPGVTVQQTAHGQASPFVRGVTGQQVLVAFDGVRLNNGTYRYGPNQYFFTIDAATLGHLEVLRGSASTRWGSDALGGAILAVPTEPTLDPEREGLSLHPRVTGRFGSADLDLGGRLELDAQLSKNVAVLAGGGYRDAQELEGGGILLNPRNGERARVPLIEPDGRTQHGTGFRYGTFDVRLLAKLAPRVYVVGAVYGFRQYDTPRTDRCPPPFADLSECLRFVHQFHTLAYASLRGAPSHDWQDVMLTLSYQRQDEHRVNDRPPSFVRYDDRDNVDTLGLLARGGSRRFALGEHAGLVFRGGADAYHDQVTSSESITFTDLHIVLPQSRGQYSDGATYVTAGAWAEAEVDLYERVLVRGALRWAAAAADAQGDPASGTAALNRRWSLPVARIGVQLRLGREASLIANVDQGFRAPNLDDLTSRQIVGPGFQFENASLRPETSTTYELGARVGRGGLQVDAWTYAMQIDDSITRAPKSIAECPPMTPTCAASWTRFQLVNVPGSSWILGAELALRLSTRFGLGARATFAATRGDGPNPSARPSVPGVAYDERVPLSRIPPINGTVELRYENAPTRLVFGAAMRWALAQDRLAPADLGDARIPLGGTPGYVTFELRAGWRVEGHLRANLVFENIFDEIYRVHGSGVNGAGRGLMLQVEGAY